jgi:hypothetical protein
MSWGLPFIQPQFTSLHFTAFSMISPPPLHFALFITFLTPFLKLLGLQERVSKTSAGSWFQSWVVLLTKEYFPIFVFCFLFLIFPLYVGQASCSSIIIWYDPISFPIRWNKTWQTFVHSDSDFTPSWTPWRTSLEADSRKNVPKTWSFTFLLIAAE